MKENKGHWRKFVAFTFIFGLAVAFFSVISDNLPYLGDGVTLTIFEFIVFYLAVMINSLPIWFILAMLVGYVFARSIREATFLGATYTVFAITLYFVIEYFYTDAPVSSSFKERVGVLMIWYGLSAAGGILGGGLGFLLKKKPYALLILFAGIILQLFLNGTRSWSDIVGIAQNVTYCLMAVSIIGYLVIMKKN